MVAIALHGFIQGLLILRVLLRPHRQPASRIAWVIVIIVLPVLGLVAYLLLEKRILAGSALSRFEQS